MNDIIPYQPLTHDARAWLLSVYALQKVGKRVEYSEVWRSVNSKVRPDFDPNIIDRRFINAYKEQIFIQGVVALEQSERFLNMIDEVMNAAKRLVFDNGVHEPIFYKSIMDQTDFSLHDVQFIFNCLPEVGKYYTDFEYGGLIPFPIAVRVAADGQVFENYRIFPGIRKLLQARYHHILTRLDYPDIING